MMKLGKIKKISDLRNVWKNGAIDFYKWLARQENLGILSNEIGINILIVAEEFEVTTSSVAVIADGERGTDIIIGAQFEKTDLDQLERLRTYASKYNAKTIIWIVNEFRSEYKSAIDRLNEHTDEKIKFFLITIELWQIEDSPIAPKFNIVCQPNT